MTAKKPTTTVYIAISLDGYIARPDGAIDWLGEPEEGEDYGWAEFMAMVDATIMGRGTFQEVLEFGAWPYEGTPVTVLSTTMTTVPEQLQGKAEASSLEPHALLQRLAVLARPVLLLLINSRVGLESLHVGGVRMAATAERGDLLRFGNADIGIGVEGGIHGCVHVLAQGGV